MDVDSNKFLFMGYTHYRNKVQYEETFTMDITMENLQCTLQWKILQCTLQWKPKIQWTLHGKPKF